MKDAYRFAELFLLLSFAVISVETAYGQTGPLVWTIPSLARVGPTDAAGTSNSISLYAAKGESESFQVVVRAPQGGLSGVNLSVSDLTGPAGAVIPHTQLTLYREYYVNIPASSPNLGGPNTPLPPGMYPDALIPFVDPVTGKPLSGATYVAVPFALPAGQNQPIWIDIAVPTTAAPGLYSGTVTVTSAQGTATTSLSLKVWNFTLPAQPTLKSSFGYHPPLVDNVPAAQVLLQNRIMPFQVPASSSGSLVTQGLNATGLPFFSSQNNSTCTISAPPTVSTITSAVQSYATGLEHYEYAADEITSCLPYISQYLDPWSLNVHAAGSKVLVTVIPDPSLANDGTGRSMVDIFVVLPKQAVASASSLAAVQTNGYEVWTYNTLVQDNYSPKWEIDFAPINYRVQPGFLNQRFGYTGLLYYGVDSWSSDPWNNVYVQNAGGNSYPGDGILVYPGQQVGVSGVVPSMRLKWLRDGADDFEYIQLLKKAGQANWAMQVIMSVASDWVNWTKNPAALEAARIQFGNQLDQSTTSPPPAPAANPTPATGSTGIPTSTTLQWSAVSGATQYQVYLGTNPTNLPVYATLPSPGQTIATVTQTVSNLNSGTTYYWQVVTSNGVTSSTGPVWSFTTAGQALTVPSNPSPASGSTGNPTSVTLGWAAAAGATRYQVYFSDVASRLSLWATLNAPTATYPISNLSAGTTYYWQIVASDGVTSSTGPVWSFATGQPLSAPSNLSPANGSTGNPTSVTVGWAAAAGATQYKVYYRSVASSMSLCATLNAPTASYSISNLSAGMTYYWQIVASNGVTSSAGPVWSFTTGQPLTAPSNPWPAIGSTGNPTSLTVQWAASTGATQYQVYLSDVLSSLSLWGTVSAPTTSYSFSNLPKHSTLYWKVVALNGSTSMSSPVWTFKTH